MVSKLGSLTSQVSLRHVLADVGLYKYMSIYMQVVWLVSIRLDQRDKAELEHARRVAGVLSDRCCGMAHIVVHNFPWRTSVLHWPW